MTINLFPLITTCLSVPRSRPPLLPFALSLSNLVLSGVEGDTHLWIILNENRSSHSELNYGHGEATPVR
jgi:hypothetical protein